MAEKKSSKTVFGKIADKLRSSKPSGVTQEAETFASVLEATHVKHANLALLASEEVRKNPSSENKEKLARLETIGFFVQRAIDEAAEYGEKFSG